MLDSLQITPNDDEQPSTPELSSPALAAMAGSLSNKPEETPEYYWSMVTEDGRALMDVPDALKTPEFCRAAVEQNGRALEFVPDALKTAKLCRAAVERDGGTLQYVPEVLKRRGFAGPQSCRKGGLCNTSPKH